MTQQFRDPNPGGTEHPEEEWDLLFLCFLLRSKENIPRIPPQLIDQKCLTCPVLNQSLAKGRQLL